MKIRARRRLAAGLALTASAAAVGVVLLPTSPASAAITSVTPSSVFSDESRTITIGLPGPIPPTVIPPESVVVFSRNGGGADVIGYTNPQTSPTSVTADVDFTDDGNFNSDRFQSADGPANPGVYDVTIYDPSYDVGNPAAEELESCANNSCFTILTRTPPTITSLSPNAVRAGSTNTITLTGTSFTRGTLIEVLQPNGQPDTTITTNAIPSPSDGDYTTHTSMVRRFMVPNGADTGARSVRVTNLDGSTTTCTNCFTIQGAAITSVVPNGGNNSPSYVRPGSASSDSTRNSHRVTFNGSALSGTPSLRYVGTTAGSSTPTELTIPGTVVGQPSDSATSVQADFDLRNAAPGSNAYQPVLTQGNGTINACDCRFSVLQPAAASTQGLDSDPGTPNNQFSQRRNTTQKYDAIGTNYSKGVRIEVLGGGVTTSSVEFVSSTLVRPTFVVAAGAAPGIRDVTTTTTDGVTTTCTACFVVSSDPPATSSATPTPTGTATATATPTATTSASASATPTATATSTSTSSVTPSSTAAANAPGRYVALDTPTRVLDSRPGTLKGTSQGPKSGPVTVDLTPFISGVAQSAVLNVTVTNADRTGFVVVYPQGTSKPPTSNVNYLANQIQANEVVTRINPANKQVIVSVENSSAHIIVDIVGYFTDASSATGRVVLQAPQRVLGSALERNSGNGTVEVDLTGRVPSGATSALVNLTVAGFDAPSGFLVAYPAGTNQPATSNVNVVAGVVQANEAIVRLGTGSSANKIRLTLSRGSARLIVDVVGGVVPGNAGTQLTPLTSPLRVLDTRPNTNVGATPGKRAGGSSLSIGFPSSIPSDATGVVLNVTTTGAATGDSGFVVVYPSGTAQPPTSNVNWRSGVNQANEVISGVGNDDRVTLTVGGAQADAGVHLVVDVVGYLR